MNSKTSVQEFSFACRADDPVEFYITTVHKKVPFTVDFKDIKTHTPTSIILLKNFNSFVIDLVRKRLVINGGRHLLLKNVDCDSFLVWRRRCRKATDKPDVLESYILAVKTNEDLYGIEVFGNGSWKFITSL